MAQIRPLPAMHSGGARVPPHNLEAEESVLGAMMLSRHAVGEVLEICHAEDFYREAHEHICRAILDLFSRGEPVDAVTVGDELKRRGQLEQVGGHPTIYQLVSSVPIAANAAFYARIVAEHATLRRVIDAATQIAQEAYEAPSDVESMVNRAEELIYGVSARRIGGDFVQIRDMLDESMQHLENLSNRTSDVTGLATGFADLDELTSGLQPGNLILVAARPAMGKSSLVMNIAHYVALMERKAVACFSLEMSWMEIVQRLICAEARVDTKRLRTGHLTEADWTRVSNAVGRLAEAPLFIDDTPSIAMMEIRAKCRRLKDRHDLGLVVIDYIQLMNSSRRIENRVQEVAEISRSLKILAKELELPVVAVSQLSRQPEQAGRGGDRRPRLADLRESGSLEQDADIVMFVYRDEVYNQETTKRGEAELIVAKHRNGPTGTVDLAFLGQYTKFADLARA
ncbi:MAG: replicative DNA helicase [Actinomycetota bacterium]|nr:replicative DNA helicase [Actinomycetota bacterium]